MGFFLQLGNYCSNYINMYFLFLENISQFSYS